MSGRILWDPDVQGALLCKVQERLFLLAEALENQSQIFKGPAPGAGHGLTDDDKDDVGRWDEFIKTVRFVNSEVHELICDLCSEDDNHPRLVRPIRDLFREMVVSLLAFIDPIVSAVILYEALLSRLELLDEACRGGMTSVDDYVFTLREDRI